MFCEICVQSYDFFFKSCWFSEIFCTFAPRNHPAWGFFYDIKVHDESYYYSYSYAVCRDGHTGSRRGPRSCY